MLKKLSAICCAALVLFGLANLCACSSGRVAATVQGHDITEEEVTAYIDTYRSGVQCTEDAAWASYLASKGVTPESLRTTTIYELAAPVIVKSKADELGLTVDEAAVDAQVNAIRSSLLVEDDDSWSSELERFGTTEEQLYERYSNKNLEDQVFASITKDIEPTEADISNYVKDNLLGVTTKKVACIYGDDYVAMQAMLDTVQGAASDKKGFAKAKQLCDDETTNFADVGWDLTCELTSNMANVVSSLSKGQAAESLLSENGTYYLFYIVKDYTFPQDVSKLDLSDKSLKQSVIELAGASLTQAAGSVWLQQQIESNLTINPMPQGLSYDVDMSQAETTEESESASTAQSTE